MKDHKETPWALERSQIVEGVWEGIVTGGAAAPVLTARHFDREIAGLEIVEAGAMGGWRVRVPIPPETIGDGIQTYVLADDGGATVASFSILAGEALSDDIRAEIDLLRQELDMLKRAFRRHCVETG